MVPFDGSERIWRRVSIMIIFVLLVPSLWFWVLVPRGLNGFDKDHKKGGIIHLPPFIIHSVLLVYDRLLIIHFTQDLTVDALLS